MSNGWSPLTEQDQLEISAVVHQNYHMPDVFKTVAHIIRRHEIQRLAADIRHTLDRL